MLHKYTMFSCAHYVHMGPIAWWMGPTLDKVFPKTTLDYKSKHPISVLFRTILPFFPRSLSLKCLQVKVGSVKTPTRKFLGITYPREKPIILTIYITENRPRAGMVHHDTINDLMHQDTNSSWKSAWNILPTASHQTCELHSWRQLGHHPSRNYTVQQQRVDPLILAVSFVPLQQQSKSFRPRIWQVTITQQSFKAHFYRPYLHARMHRPCISSTCHLHHIQRLAIASIKQARPPHVHWLWTTDFHDPSVLYPVEQLWVTNAA